MSDLRMFHVERGTLCATSWSYSSSASSNQQLSFMALTPVETKAVLLGARRSRVRSTRRYVQGAQDAAICAESRERSSWVGAHSSKCIARCTEFEVARCLVLGPSGRSLNRESERGSAVFVRGERASASKTTTFFRFFAQNPRPLGSPNSVSKPENPKTRP